MEAKKRVTVVDDDEDILEFVKLALEYEGYDVETKASGGCLPHMPPGDLPDLLLLDIQLSGESGLELCHQLKENEDTKHLPIILYSAYESASEIRKEGCADDVLAKPFSLQTLIDKVHRLLS